MGVVSTPKDVAPQEISSGVPTPGTFGDPRTPPAFEPQYVMEPWGMGVISPSQDIAPQISSQAAAPGAFDDPRAPRGGYDMPQGYYGQEQFRTQILGRSPQQVVYMGPQPVGLQRTISRPQLSAGSPSPDPRARSLTWLQKQPALSPASVSPAPPPMPPSGERLALGSARPPAPRRELRYQR